ncbi:hypothetical protein MINTM008_41930 [Mycobacterium intracellulare]|uniref:Universal stress protein n=3 Tax=Mycobacterium avium complex (MAC) TaxID=120793 RepID=A0A7R7MWS0_MYCIT|nr:Hypothetical protein MIP_05838 [Mycobacterium intracellulare subsp. intracellulare MTCC 9506]OBG14344.1 universal stress protein [Mycobacterium intracellulare]BBY68407.1 hypothetical protein MPRI_05940 [Mycobacterium paraintracellulare]BCP38602.1 hypothetical protein MINTMi198_39720 [Mycobacterium intracellulare M.i.198]BCO43003.1 hypothetical protein MINTM001_41420 [Mycobacterium paraintracellulare]
MVRAALFPVAVIHRSTSRRLAQVGTVVAEVDNGTVLRHAFEEARLRGATLRAVSISRDAALGNFTAPAQLDRRLARWMRLYPDAHAEQALRARDPLWQPMNRAPGRTGNDDR